MKFTKEERLEVGRKIHELGLSNLKAAKVFGISEESARRYHLQYKAAHQIRAHHSVQIPFYIWAKDGL